MAKQSLIGKKIYLVNRDFQLRYALAAIIVGLLTTLLTVCLLLVPLFVFEILRIPRFLPIPILLAIGFAALANIAIIGFLGVLVTHRIAGPMFSLVRCMRRVELGRWAGSLQVRKNDDLRYVVRNFNQMVDGLVEIARSDLGLANKALETFASREAHGSEGEVDAIVALKELKSRMEYRLSEESFIGEQDRES